MHEETRSRLIESFTQWSSGPCEAHLVDCKESVKGPTTCRFKHLRMISSRRVESLQTVRLSCPLTHSAPAMRASFYKSSTGSGNTDCITLSTQSPRCQSSDTEGHRTLVVRHRVDNWESTASWSKSSLSFTPRVQAARRVSKGVFKVDCCTSICRVLRTGWPRRHQARSQLFGKARQFGDF